jgi:NADPH:quinone reductase-like Zn-dependent oxidoreductase
VRSIAIQLAKLAGLAAIATASRPETVQWVLALGADKVIDHSQPIPTQLFALGRKEVTSAQTLAIPTHTGRSWRI